MIVFMLALQFTHRTDNTNMPSFIILMRSSHSICDYVCIAYMCVCKCMLRINVCLTKTVALQLARKSLVKMEISQQHARMN